MNASAKSLFATKYPKRSPARPNDFDTVLTTTRFGYFFTIFDNE